MKGLFQKSDRCEQGCPIWASKHRPIRESVGNLAINPGRAQRPSFQNGRGAPSQTDVGNPAVSPCAAQKPSFPNASVGNPQLCDFLDSRQRHSGMTAFFVTFGV